ncbi:MAG: alpha/beta fold hydrolase [Deltaproteobacteria bacterium]|nr:alpha/beta fold hydrolase [Deltaproteobacteria bacterium]
MTLHTIDQGPRDGDVVVVLHSGGMSSRQWRKLIELLSKTRRAVAPDFLGSGQNPPWPADAPFHFDDDVAAVDDLIKGIGKPVHLVGHSYGGLACLVLARRDPMRVRSLCLYDPVAWGVLQDDDDAALGAAARARVLTNASGPGVLGGPRGAGATPGLDTMNPVGGSAAWFEQFVDYWSGEGAWQGLSEGARGAFLAVGRKVFLEVASLLADQTPASSYADIQAPTILLRGEHTPIAAQRVSAILAKAMPAATLHTVAGAGHMGPITHADVVNELIAAHIAAATR